MNGLCFYLKKINLHCNWTRTQNHLVCKWTLNLWPNGWVFVYKLSGSGFKSGCSHLNFKFCACFEQGVPWHSGNYRVWIHSEMCTWHDKKIKINLHLQKMEIFKISKKSLCIFYKIKFTSFVNYCLKLSW